MMLSVTGCKHNKKVFAHIRQIPKKTRRGIQNAFLKIKQHLLKTARASMQEDKHGRWYMVYWSPAGRRLRRARRHRASKKGESPAIVSGRLFRSLGGSTKYGRILTFGAGTDYAKYLELGGRSFLLQSINRSERDTEKYFEDEIQKELETL